MHFRSCLLHPDMFVLLIVFGQHLKLNQVKMFIFSVNEAIEFMWTGDVYTNYYIIIFLLFPVLFIFLCCKVIKDFLYNFLLLCYECSLSRLWFIQCINVRPLSFTNSYARRIVHEFDWLNHYFVTLKLQNFAQFTESGVSLWHSYYGSTCLRFGHKVYSVNNKQSDWWIQYAIY